jgi:hypothetical protein
LGFVSFAEILWLQKAVFSLDGGVELIVFALPSYATRLPASLAMPVMLACFTPLHAFLALRFASAPDIQ